MDPEKEEMDWTSKEKSIVEDLQGIQSNKLH